MRKIISLIIAVYLISSMASCGGRNKVEDMASDITEKITDIVGDMTGKETDKESAKETDSDTAKGSSSEELLARVWDAIPEDDRPTIYGGDSANIINNRPGAFDISMTDELDVTLAFPMAHVGNIDDAASMVHMMNANTFTGSAYKLKNGVSADTFAADFKKTIGDRKWVCGFPECFTVIEAEGHVICAFGGRSLVETFRDSAKNTLSGARVIMTEDIA